jgi:hypothetical protein
VRVAGRALTSQRGSWGPPATPEPGAEPGGASLEKDFPLSLIEDWDGISGSRGRHRDFCTERAVQSLWCWGQESGWLCAKVQGSLGAGSDEFPDLLTLGNDH